MDQIGVCECKNGFTGLNCQTPPDACATVVCFNGGFCKDGVCHCQKGFQGAFCDSAKTPTDKSCGGERACENGGVCILGGCNCFNGFEGKYCEIDTSNGGSCGDVTKNVFESSASSALPGSEADKGFDNSDATTTDAPRCGGNNNSTCDEPEIYWHSLGRPPQWLAVDFGSSPRALCAFNFGTRLDDAEGNVANDAPMEYELQYADEHGTGEDRWRTVEWYKVVHDWKVGDILRHSIEVKGKHRFWRLKVTKVKGRPDGSEFVVVRNLKLFAKLS